MTNDETLALRGAEHTPGPWYLGKFDLSDKEIEIISDSNDYSWLAKVNYDDVDHEVAAANARRIVACVNALEGIPTEKLESGEYKAQAEVEQARQEGVKTMTDQLPTGAELNAEVARMMGLDYSADTRSCWP